MLKNQHRATGSKTLIMMTAGLIVALCLAGQGCGHATVEKFDPARDEVRKASIFGFVKIVRQERDVTEGSVLTFDDGTTLQLGPDGFVAHQIQPYRAAITSFRIDGSTNQYSIPNLELRSGQPGTKTYFGHIQVRIQSPKSENMHLAETWSWKVDTTRWKEALVQWNIRFGSDQRKMYSSPARRSAPDRDLSRGIASDRQELDTGM